MQTIILHAQRDNYKAVVVAENIWQAITLLNDNKVWYDAHIVSVNPSKEKEAKIIHYVCFLKDKRWNNLLKYLDKAIKKCKEQNQ